MSVLIQIPISDAVPAYHAGPERRRDAAHVAARDAVLAREGDPLWQAMAYFDPL